MECFPEYLPNTYLNYYLQQKEFVEHSNPERTRANEVEETREKNLFDGIDHYEKTGEIDESTFYAGSHGDWIADLAIALKNDTKQRFLVICENKGAIPTCLTTPWSSCLPTLARTAPRSSAATTFRCSSRAS